METLHLDFQKVADMHTQDVIDSAKLWATWIMMADVEIGHPSDYLCHDDVDDEGRFSPEERDVLWYCLNNKPLDYKKLYEKILNIGSVESIMTLGWNTFAFMAGFFFVDPDHLDPYLESMECDGCYNAHCLYIFSYVFSEVPFTDRQCHHIAHGGFDLVKQTVGIMAEYRVDTLVNLFSEFKVERVHD